MFFITLLFFIILLLFLLQCLANDNLGFGPFPSVYDSCVRSFIKYIVNFNILFTNIYSPLKIMNYYNVTALH